MGKLTPKQEKFVDEYLVDLNAKQAAIRAGYSAKTAEVQGSKLLRNPKVAEEVTRRRTQIKERLEINQEWVVARLVDNVERAMQAQPVKDREGNVTGDYVYQGAVANGALGLLGRFLGMFGPKGTEDDPKHNVNQSLDEWKAKAMQRRAEAEAILSEEPEHDAGHE